MSQWREELGTIHEEIPIQNLDQQNQRSNSQLQESLKNPIGILNIKEGCVWLSFQKRKFYQPDIEIMSYQEARIYYPSLVAERLLYQKLNYAQMTDNTENQQQGCIFDLTDQQCLVKWFPSEQFSWIDIGQTEPQLILEYLESRETQQIVY